MKLSKLVAGSLMALVTLIIAACGGKQSAETSGNPNVITLEEAESRFAGSLNANDTTELMTLGSSFMDSLKNGNIDAAVAMLYEPNPQGGVRPVDAKNREQLRNRYTTYPVKRWKMDHIDLSIPSLNDMKFVYQMSDDPGMPGMAIMFNPVKSDGKWYLMLKQESQPAKDASNALPANTAVQMPENN